MKRGAMRGLSPALAGVQEALGQDLRSCTEASQFPAKKNKNGSLKAAPPADGPVRFCMSTVTKLAIRTQG